MARITYVKQSDSSVGVTYDDMPAAAELLFVNQTSGEKTAANSSALNAGGSGSADIAIPDLRAGEYYLLAQKDGDYLAQTIVFTLS